jgi:hypothetical protein
MYIMITVLAQAPHMIYKQHAQSCSIILPLQPSAWSGILRNCGRLQTTVWNHLKIRHFTRSLKTCRQVAEIVRGSQNIVWNHQAINWTCLHGNLRSAGRVVAQPELWLNWKGCYWQIFMLMEGLLESWKACWKPAGNLDYDWTGRVVGNLRSSGRVVTDIDIYVD